MVVTQAGVPRSRAVKALKAANGDIVAAIMKVKPDFCQSLPLLCSIFCIIALAK
ncbi:nascent polypeptide-associated complex subunit alpha-like [Trifolium medium]|uniref:Nascent polypeptide-associated complex subunit alpha-like n=1 Tax=Trifolium medium TaxID=97028 RepID=A0A392SQR4_9FABA|nr:nascent polypeptide-associated complex subunit alpha-like [Trifolium medium]